MSFWRRARSIRPFTIPHRPLTTPRRTYASKVPFNFFSITSMGTAASFGTGRFPSEPYTPKYDTWPYTPSDFTRYDENDDGVFYSQPRLVTHIDDPAIARLTRYYVTVLPTKGRILDMCTSWKSFYPSEIESAVERGEVEVYGVGLNAEEMSVNTIFQSPSHWRVLDLNKAPHDVRSAWDAKEGVDFDATTCVVSIDYLNKPLEVCRDLLEATKEGGTVHLVVSNRCFPNKVVRRWHMLGERGRVELVSGKSRVTSQVDGMCSEDANLTTRLFTFLRLERRRNR